MSEELQRTRLVNKKDGSNKFYTVVIFRDDDGRFSVKGLYGPIAREHRPTTSFIGTYNNLPTAQTYASKFIKEKLKKGYEAEPTVIAQSIKKIATSRFDLDEE